MQEKRDQSPTRGSSENKTQKYVLLFVHYEGDDGSCYYLLPPEVLNEKRMLILRLWAHCSIYARDARRKDEEETPEELREEEDAMVLAMFNERPDGTFVEDSVGIVEAPAWDQYIVSRPHKEPCWLNMRLVSWFGHIHASN